MIIVYCCYLLVTSSSELSLKHINKSVQHLKMVSAVTYLCNHTTTSFYVDMLNERCYQ